MQNRYFNENEFQYAINMMETNPFEAKKRFEDYIDKYPNDYYARAYFVHLLARLDEIDYANEIFDSIKTKVNDDKSFSQSDKRIIGFKCIMALAKIKLLSLEERYDEMLEYYFNNQDSFANRYDMPFLVNFCKIKLGLSELDETSSYRLRQAGDYSDELLLEHLKKHETDYNMDIENPNESVFNPDFPLEEVLKIIRRKIPSNDHLCMGLYDDTYYFKYSNCGRINNKVANYFTVICYHNTPNIITMCPSNNCEHFPIINIDDIIIEDNAKVKTLSQIDKFNARFKRR